MTDPEEIVPVLPTQRTRFSEDKPLEDPPGWAVPLNHARQLEWWAKEQKQHQQEQVESLTIKVDATVTPLPTKVSPSSQPLHRYDDYIEATKAQSTDNDDDAFSWVPPPSTSAMHRSPDGRDLTYRTLEAQRVYETAVPGRSWAVEDDDEPMHAEQTVVTDYTHNSWIVAPSKLEQVEKEEQLQDDDEEIIEEEEEEEEIILDEETIEEEIIEEVSSHGDGGIEEEFVDEEEIMEEEEVISESGSSPRSSFSSQPFSSLLPPESEKSVSLKSLSSSSQLSKPSSFLPPKSSTLQSISKRAPEAVVSRHSESSTSRSAKHYSQSSSSSRSGKPTSSNSKNNNSTIADEITEASGSTQILYIRDPHDLDEIVQKCFNGNVLVEDEKPPILEEEFYVPSKVVLVLMTSLVLLLSLGIGVGLFFYFQRQ